MRYCVLQVRISPRSLARPGGDHAVHSTEQPASGRAPTAGPGHRVLDLLRLGQTRRAALGSSRRRREAARRDRRHPYQFRRHLRVTESARDVAAQRDSGRAQTCRTVDAGLAVAGCTSRTCQGPIRKYQPSSVDTTFPLNQGGRAERWLERVMQVRLANSASTQGRAGIADTDPGHTDSRANAAELGCVWDLDRCRSEMGSPGTGPRAGAHCLVARALSGIRDQRRRLTRRATGLASSRDAGRSAISRVNRSEHPVAGGPRAGFHQPNPPDLATDLATEYGGIQ